MTCWEGRLGDQRTVAAAVVVVVVAAVGLKKCAGGVDWCEKMLIAAGKHRQWVRGDGAAAGGFESRLASAGLLRAGRMMDWGYS